MSVKNIELEEKVNELLKRGLSTKKIASNLGYSYEYVLVIFKRLGGKLEGSGGKNRIVNSNPFSNSSESQYWLGFLAADGNISKTKHSIYLGLKDIDMVILFRDFVEKSLKVYYKYNAAGSLLGAVKFENPEIWNYLNDLGITPAKSRTLYYKGIITWDFIRGVFDGDGCISAQEPKITTGSLQFKDQLEQFFKSNDLEYKTHIKGNNIYDVYIRGNSRFEFF